jgi:hypothetical protein
MNQYGVRRLFRNLVIAIELDHLVEMTEIEIEIETEIRTEIEIILNLVITMLSLHVGRREVLMHHHVDVIQDRLHLIDMRTSIRRHQETTREIEGEGAGLHLQIEITIELLDEVTESEEKEREKERGREREKEREKERERRGVEVHIHPVIDQPLLDHTHPQDGVLPHQVAVAVEKRVTQAHQEGSSLREREMDMDTAAVADTKPRLLQVAGDAEMRGALST